MADVSVSLDLDAKQLYGELQAVSSHFVEFAGKTKAAGEQAKKGFISGFSGGFGGIGTNLAQAIASLGIGAEIKDIVEYGSKIQDLHERFGVATGTLQRFGLAAEQNGSSLEAVAKGFRFLEVNQAKALGGNDEMIRSFRELGISATDLATLRPEDIMFKIGQSSLNAADVVKILGRSSLELRPILAGLADGTIKFGGAIDALDIKRLDEADDAFKELRHNVTLLVGSGLATFLREVKETAAGLAGPILAAGIELKGLASAAALAKPDIHNLNPFTAVEKFKEMGNILSQARSDAEEAMGRGARATEEVKLEELTEKPLRDLGEAPTERTGKEDKEDERERKRQEREDERERKKEAANRERELRNAARGEAETLGSDIRARQHALNPTGLSLHDIASARIIGSRATALAREGEREEGLATQRQLAGDYRGAVEHSDRAERIKQALGLDNRFDREELKRIQEETRDYVKKVAENTEDIAANK